MVLKCATSSHTNLSIKLPCCKVKKRMVKGHKQNLKPYSKFYPWGYLLFQLNLHCKQGSKLAFIPFDMKYMSTSGCGWTVKPLSGLHSITYHGDTLECTELVRGLSLMMILLCVVRTEFQVFSLSQWRKVGVYL